MRVWILIVFQTKKSDSECSQKLLDNRRESSGNGFIEIGSEIFEESLESGMRHSIRWTEFIVTGNKRKCYEIVISRTLSKLLKSERMNNAVLFDKIGTILKLIDDDTMNFAVLVHKRKEHLFFDFLWFHRYIFLFAETPIGIERTKTSRFWWKSFIAFLPQNNTVKKHPIFILSDERYVFRDQDSTYESLKLMYHACKQACIY